MSFVHPVISLEGTIRALPFSLKKQHYVQIVALSRMLDYREWDLCMSILDDLKPQLPPELGPTIDGIISTIAQAKANEALTPQGE